MNNIFPHPIGTVRNLGTRKDWLMDAIGIAILVATAILALIIL